VPEVPEVPESATLPEIAALSPADEPILIPTPAGGTPSRSTFFLPVRHRRLVTAASLLFLVVSCFLVGLVHARHQDVDGKNRLLARGEGIQPEGTAGPIRNAVEPVELPQAPPVIAPPPVPPATEPGPLAPTPPVAANPPSESEPDEEPIQVTVNVEPGPQEPGPIVKPDQVAEPEPGPGCLGTKVDFLDHPDKAAALAKQEKKLLFILHVSGHFEDSKFT
jgi:hypothetical protein